MRWMVSINLRRMVTIDLRLVSVNWRRMITVVVRRWGALHRQESGMIELTITTFLART